MKTRKSLLLFLLIIVSLVFSFHTAAVAASPGSLNPDGPPVKVTVVVHYPHRADQVFSALAGESLVEQTGFLYDGLRWQNSSILYYTNVISARQTPITLPASRIPLPPGMPYPP
jgi:hypothetical protein